MKTEGEKVGKENIDITARVKSYDKDIVMTLKEQSLGDDTKECAIQAAHLSALCCWVDLMDVVFFFISGYHRGKMHALAATGLANGERDWVKRRILSQFIY